MSDTRVAAVWSMARAGLLALLALLPAHARAVMPSDPYFETVGNIETIPNGVVTALAQDATGFIWVGSQSGLLRYDGYRFRHYRHDQSDPGSLGDESIRDLLPLPDGRLWVATQGGGISILDPDSDRFEHLRHDPANPGSLAENAVLKLARAKDGGIWVGMANQGLDYWDPQSRRFLHFPPDPDNPAGLPQETARSLLVDRRGDLWVGTRNGLVRKRDGAAGFERIASDPAQPGSLSGQYVYGLFQASDGRIWAGTQNNGAVVIDPADGSYRRLPVDPDSPYGLGHPWVSTLIEPTPGQLWLFTFGAGIDVIDAASLRVVQRLRHDPAIASSLALDLLTNPLIDRSGLLWIGTWGAGLIRHNPTAAAFRSLRHSPLRKAGLSQSGVYSALAWPEGQLWLGTAGNGIDVYHPERGWLPGLRPSRHQPGALRDGTIRALARTGDGTVWAGTQQAGLHRWLGETQGFRYVPHAGGGDDERIVALQAINNGHLLVASQRGLAELDPATERVSVVLLESGEPFTDAVVSLAEDGQGNLFVASAVGLLVRPAGQQRLRRVPANRGRPGALSHTTLLSLHVDGNDQLWLAHGGGIDRLTGWSADGLPQFEPLQLQHNTEIGASGGNHLQSDDQGRLWTERTVIDPVQHTAHGFGRPDGVDVGSSALGAAIRTPEGLLVFGGTLGVVLIDPSRYRPWATVPPLVVSDFLIDGVHQPLQRLQGGVTLQPEQRRLEIEFSALDLSAPDANQYAYRLQPYDQDWISGDASRRSAQYSKLWPGDYLLRARASNRDGQWSPNELAIPVRVLPAWWQTPWFAVLLVLALSLLIYAGVRWRTEKIRHDAQALDALVKQRTDELSHAKEQAEQTLDDLIGAQKQLVAAEKMASLGQMVAGIAHEINTPIGIAVTAVSHMQDLSNTFGAKVDAGKLTRTDLGSWRAGVEEGSRLVLGSLQRAHTLIGSFKQVAVDQSSEQRRRFDLKTFLNEVQFALQPSYKRTPHTLEIDCPDGIELDTYPGALFQILTNLVNNSLLHAFAEGQAGLIRVMARASGDGQIHLLYYDDGQGMSAEVVTRAFDPFFTTRRGTGGSGLGLHLVYNLTTQLLGGDIELHSSPEQGTEFEIRFPAQAPAGRA